MHGEQALQVSGAAYVILHTAWVYGANFVKTILRLMSEREEIGVVANQIGTPTYIRDLAQAIMQIIETPGFIHRVYIINRVTI